MKIIPQNVFWIMKTSKNYYRLIAVDLSWQKKLHADPKATQQTEFVGQLKIADNQIVDDETMIVLTILEKSKKGD